MGTHLTLDERKVSSPMCRQKLAALFVNLVPSGEYDCYDRLSHNRNTQRKPEYTVMENTT